MRTLVGDTDYQVKPTDTLVILDEPITAPRTWTLPQGGVFDGERLTVIDGTDSVDETNTLTIDAPANVYLNGVSGGTFVLTTPGGLVDLINIGPSAWKAVSADQNASLIPGLLVRNITFGFDTTDIDTGAELITPEAGETLVSISGDISVAWDSSTSDDLDIGITGTADAYVAAQDAQVAAPLTIEATAPKTAFDGATAIIATVTSVGDPPTEGTATVTIITVKTGG